MNFTEGMVFGENSIWIFGRASGLWSGNRSACFFVVPGKSWATHLIWRFTQCFVFRCKKTCSAAHNIKICIDKQYYIIYSIDMKQILYEV